MKNIEMNTSRPGDPLRVCGLQTLSRVRTPQTLPGLRAWLMLSLGMTVILFSGCGPSADTSQRVIDDHGAIIRMDTTLPRIYLVFTGHEYAEGYPVVRQVFREHDIRASFFFTGDFYREPDFKPMIRELVEEGHYLGAHSDKHLLYCDWEKRDSLLVDQATFTRDLLDNYKEMARFGISKADAPFFMPPYEWYNMTISRWTRELGLTLVNFSPGTRSNADYTWPEMGTGYVDSETIVQNILDYEEANGMNGFILLVHLGTDPRREDKLYDRLDELVKVLKERGYGFARF